MFSFLFGKSTGKPSPSATSTPSTDKAKDETPIKSSNRNQFCVPTDLKNEDSFVVIDRNVDTNPLTTSFRTTRTKDNPMVDNHQYFMDTFIEVQENLKTEAASRVNGRKPAAMDRMEKTRVEIQANRAAKVAAEEMMELQRAREKRRREVESRGMGGSRGENRRDGWSSGQSER